MQIKATKKEAYKLLLQGAKTLSDMEETGMSVDVEYVRKARAGIKRKIERLESELKEDSLYKYWERRFRSKTKLSSRPQLLEVLTDKVLSEKQLKGMKRTKGGKLQMDEAALERIDVPFVKTYMKIEKLKKADSTFLNGIESNISWDGRLRTFWNLHSVQTFRSSSDSPNFQNMPIRNPEFAKIIRSCFRASSGHVIVEIDFTGAEVRMAACYNHDPKLISYILDPTKDMHRDMAAEIYMIDESEVTKAVRHTAKNLFVFPQFYGDYYLNCAVNMWNAITRHELEVDGVPILDHLKSKGIKRLGNVEDARNNGKGTFIHHMRNIEDSFWNNRFAVYNEWKRRHWSAYLNTGYLEMLTGFRISGIINRKQCINTPIQGSAFHCLLWSLIQVHRDLLRYKIPARLTMQIHDSMIAIVRDDSVEEYLSLVKHIMTERLLQHWKWINVPFEIEAEVTPSGGTWYEKKAVKI